MSETPRQPTDAAKLFDDQPMIFHTHGVRVKRNSVNLESVRVPCDYAVMENDQTIGARFRVLVKRSGLSMRDLASKAGFNGASGIQRYVDVNHEKPLGVDQAKRFADAMAGLGEPPITRDEVMSLTGFVDRVSSNAEPVHFEGSSLARMRDDMPVFGTALGAEMIIEGERIEQTMLNTGDVIEYRKRPVMANGVERVYGLYVQGESMYPAHRDGAFLYAQREAPLRADDDVVVYLRPKDESDDGERAICVLVKRLIKRTSQYIELEQYRPAKIFRIEMRDVVRVDRVLTYDDMG